MKTAIVTASYANDFQRCKLLCETVDAHAKNFTRHYLLVEPKDIALFSSLTGPNRVVVDERELLPSWLKVFPDPFSGGKRRVWLSPFMKPLRGWHVQQLRRMGLAHAVDEDALFFIDSDVAILKDIDSAQLWREGRLRLLRRENALVTPPSEEHLVWSRNAARVLGIQPPAPGPHDYIGTLVATRSDMTLAMCAHIERITGVPWARAIGRMRQFSEDMIYGRYVDDIEGGKGHFHDDRDLCRVYWSGPVPTEGDFHAFVDAMAPDQVAIGMQSFVGLDVNVIRRLIGL